MLLTDAVVYVARVMGGANNTAKTALAAESILAVAEQWTQKHDWHYLLNRQTITLAPGTSRYALTLAGAFSKPHSCRFTDTLLRPLSYKTQAEIDDVTYDQTIPGDPEVYTIVDDDVDFDPTAEVQKVQFYPTPSVVGTILLRLYRAINGSAASIDVPNRYLRTFLDHARIHLMMTHDSTNPRLGPLMLDMFGNGQEPGRLKLAIAHDTNEGGEDQFEGFKVRRHSGFIPQGPSDFYPKGDY